MRRPRTAPRRDGIAVVMLIGVMSILLLLAFLLAQIGSLAAASSQAFLKRAVASSAAASGLEYAAARLWADPRPVPADLRTPQNAGDDWTFRDGWTVPPGLSSTPSYAHRETSGRLRCGDGRFSLRVQAEEGKACLNSGEIGSPLADHDMDGVLNGEDPKYAAEIPPGAYCDPTFWGNVHLVNLLNNLGAVLELSDVHDEEYEAPSFWSTGEMGTIRVSNLGRTVVANRPEGGYVSVDQLRPFLPPADFEKVAPFLATDGEVVPVPITPDSPFNAARYDMATGYPDARLEFHARIDFNAAPIEILKASLRHIASGGDSLFIRLREGEADAIAERLSGLRPVHGWAEMLELLHAGRLATFEDDPFTKLEDGSPLDERTDPGRQRLKEDLILANAAADGYFPDSLRWRHNSLEVPREDQPIALDPPVARQVFKELLVDPLNTYPFGASGCGGGGELPATFPSRRTIEWSLTALPTAFHVTSHATAGRPAARAEASGTFHVGLDAITLKSQDDFERRGASPAAPAHLPGGFAAAISPASRSGAATFPRFPLDSSETGLDNYDPATIPPANAESLGQFRYPRGRGGLTLGAPQHPYAADLERTVFSMPFNEDFPDDADTAYSPSRWEDNLLDPVEPARRSAPPATAAWGGQSNYAKNNALFLTHPDRYRNFHAGCHLSPWGPRAGWAWAAWTSPFPLARGNHSGCGIPGSGEIRDGAIECWYPMPVTHDPISVAWSQCLPGGICRIVYNGSLNGPTLNEDDPTYLLVSVRPDGSISLDDAIAFTPPVIYAPAAKRAWHHLALRFDASSFPPGSDDTKVHVYLDGIEQPVPFTLSFGAAPLDAQMAIEPHFPLDDFCLYPAGEATDAAILGRAQASRFSTSGAWTSPRFRLDGAALPDGAGVRGLSWNGFIPSGTGGAFTFTVRGFEADGTTPTGSDAASWNGGAGPQMSRLNVPTSRQVELEVRIDTDPAEWPLVAGVSSLRDAPVLDELKIVYASRPRWTGWACD